LPEREPTPTLRAVATAVAFLTPLPVPARWQGAPLARAAAFFPLAGYLLGGLLALAAGLLHPQPAGLRGPILFAFELALTGALHYDALLDLADALPLPAPPERRRAALRDPHVGAFAVGFGAAAALLHAHALALAPPLTLPLAAAWARALPPALAHRFPLAPEGLGAQLLGAPLALPLLLAAPALLLHPAAALLAAAGAYGLAAVARRRLGWINGDVLGGAIVLAELLYLLAAR